MQSMNFLAAMLLLVLEKDEESAFWVLVALIDDGANAGSQLHPLCSPTRKGARRRPLASRKHL